MTLSTPLTIRDADATATGTVTWAPAEYGHAEGWDVEDLTVEVDGEDVTETLTAAEIEAARERLAEAAGTRRATRAEHAYQQWKDGRCGL
jgi:hypothetical protein